MNPYTYIYKAWKIGWLQIIALGSLPYHISLIQCSMYSMYHGFHNVGMIFPLATVVKGIKLVFSAHPSVCVCVC